MRKPQLTYNWTDALAIAGGGRTSCSVRIPRSSDSSRTTPTRSSGFAIVSRNALSNIEGLAVYGVARDFLSLVVDTQKATQSAILKASSIQSR